MSGKYPFQLQVLAHVPNEGVFVLLARVPFERKFSLPASDPEEEKSRRRAG